MAFVSAAPVVALWAMVENEARFLLGPSLSGDARIVEARCTDTAPPRFELRGPYPSVDAQHDLSHGPTGHAVDAGDQPDLPCPAAAAVVAHPGDWRAGLVRGVPAAEGAEPNLRRPNPAREDASICAAGRPVLPTTLVTVASMSPPAPCDVRARFGPMKADGGTNAALAVLARRLKGKRWW